MIQYVYKRLIFLLAILLFIFFYLYTTTNNQSGFISTDYREPLEYTRTHWTTPEERFSEDFPLNDSWGEGAWYAMASMHTPILDCKVPESSTFSCLENTWELHFRVYTTREQCDIIESKHHKELCISGSSKEVEDMKKFMMPFAYSTLSRRWKYDENKNFTLEEYNNAFDIFADLQIHIKKCDSSLSNLECIKAQWELVFKKGIPEGKESYCELISAQIHKRLCLSALPKSLDELEKPFKKSI